jgi:hypothetical protein
LVGKPEGKRPPGRPRRRWEDNIKKNLQEVECGSMDWIELAQNGDRGGDLCMPYCIYGFHKVWGIS